jgi:sugar phosphate isomerase/epimerase
MTKKRLERRRFIKAAAAAGITAATFALPARGRAAGKKHPIRLGGPLKMPEDPEEMALACRKVGYRAAYCPPVSLEEPDRIRAIARAFQKHDVVIAEVGRWVNLLDADPATRKKHLDKVTEGLALADALGARCCVDIAGSYNTKVWYGPHPDNLSDRFFEEAVENARKIIDAVKPRRAKFSYEMMGWALPDSPDSYLDFIKAVDRDAFAVHLDPCNLVNSPRRFYRNAALIEECFEKLGRWIVSCHAKDLAWDVEMNVHFREVRPGAGSIDYRTYLRRLSMLPQSPPLMLEHLPNAEEYDRARMHILDLGRSLGLDIGAPGSGS